LKNCPLDPRKNVCLNKSFWRSETAEPFFKKVPGRSNSNFTTKNTKSTKGKIRKDFNYLLFLYFIFVSFVSFVVQNPKLELLSWSPKA